MTAHHRPASPPVQRDATVQRVAPLVNFSLSGAARNMIADRYMIAYTVLLRMIELSISASPTAQLYVSSLHALWLQSLVPNLTSEITS